MRLMCTLILLSVCALAGCRKHADPSARVILVSIDGFRADYLQRGLSPNLHWLASHGVRAQWMTPSFPTETYPNHYTLVTGLYPDRNGVIGNEMEDAANGLHSTLTRREGTGDKE